jgi:hypothetical protein
MPYIIKVKPQKHLEKTTTTKNKKTKTKQKKRVCRRRNGTSLFFA